ncbi:MAG: hypothetical protein BWY99_02082 [Synergistetes bacterium ADurb.BinA166]|nr:MAG: hypothetical protein BWY99_02082 [Synergistetes bacterium ADurb.BinA166]
MNEEYLADILIIRLNGILDDPDIRKDVNRLVETRIPVSKATADHRTIQVTAEGEESTLGFLGLLNGLVGAMPKEYGRFAGWGYIAAEYDDEGNLVKFVRTGRTP